MCVEFSSDLVLTHCFASLDVMKQFDHPHIIRLIGLCMDPPIYIIMELAPHGEVREKLQSCLKKEMLKA